MTASELAASVGFEHFGQLSMDSLVLRKEVRAMCDPEKCTRYARSWSCPPRVGSLEEIAQRIAPYTEGILVQTEGAMDGPFDMEGIRKANRLHSERFAAFARQMKAELGDVFPMGAGSCTICRKCTYPARPCRHPDRMHPSMEACGLMVADVCSASGMKYNYGQDTITFTSLVLYGREDR